MNRKQVLNAAEFGKVAVLMGGMAAEREISLSSGNAVLNALQKRGIDAEGIDISDDFVSPLLNDKIDRVFNIIHGRGGEDGLLQGILEAMRIPYTGSGVLASALSMDKLRTKLCWLGQGLPTPPWCLLQNPGDITKCMDKLGFPVIVKPAMEGSSLGMSKAHNEQELIAAWHKASEYQCDVYAEAWVSGKEYTVAVLQNEALPIIRLQTPNAFYDYQAKYIANTTHYHCPCGLQKQQEEQLQQLALQACRTIGVSGWGRVDVFIDDADNAQLIEVNTVPGMTDHSLVPMAANASGVDFEELTWRILETSMKDN